MVAAKTLVRDTYVGDPKPENTKGGKKPRQVGKQAESQIAKRTGGSRVPSSGAIKNSNHDLTGDVRITDAKGRPFIKTEVKVCGTEDTQGRKSFRVTWEVVDQMIREASEAHQLGVLDVHFKGESYDHDLIIMKASDFYQLLEHAKQGAALT